jgi:hypothetical protein
VAFCRYDLSEAVDGQNNRLGARKEESNVSASSDKYDVRVDWTTVVPLGDTLAVSADDGFDDQWVEAFEVVLDEHERQPNDRKWGGIDFDYAADEEVRFVLYLREIEPEARSVELRRTMDDLMKATNIVAQVGTHVYELAGELREPEPATPRVSTPPPFDPLADELPTDAP